MSDLLRSCGLGTTLLFVAACSTGSSGSSADMSVFVKKMGFENLNPPQDHWNVGTMLSVGRDIFRNPTTMDVICVPSIEAPTEWANVQPAIVTSTTGDTENVENTSLKGELSASSDAIAAVNAKLASSGSSKSDGTSGTIPGPSTSTGSSPGLKASAQQVRKLDLKITNARIISIDLMSLSRLQESLEKKCASIIADRLRGPYDIRIVSKIFIADGVYTGETTTGQNITVNGDIKKISTVGLSFDHSDDATTKQTGKQLTYGVHWPDKSKP